jgi:hypothetical protein
VGVGVCLGEEGLLYIKTPRPGFIPWERERERDEMNTDGEEVNEGEGSHCSVWNVVWF